MMGRITCCEDKTPGKTNRRAAIAGRELVQDLEAAFRLLDSENKGSLTLPQAGRHLGLVVGVLPQGFSNTYSTNHLFIPSEIRVCLCAFLLEALGRQSTSSVGHHGGPEDAGASNLSNQFDTSCQSRTYLGLHLGIARICGVSFK